LDNFPYLLRMFDLNQRELARKSKQQILSTLEMSGNFRLDCVTAGISTEVVDGRPRFIIIEARGQFDHKTVMSAMKKIDTPRDRDGMEVFDVDGGGCLAFLGDNRVIAIEGHGNENL